MGVVRSPAVSEVTLIDTMHQGLDRVIGAWERDGLIVDPGPAPTIDNVLGSIEGGEPRAVLLTHIHLDHAGATGTLVSRFPDLPVYVHEVGAPHLIDPSRLLRSAGMLYGDQMERLWGEVLPVPEANITPLSGGETVEGLDVIATPGHASHHVCYFDTGTGDAFVGDIGGVRVPPSDTVWLPTPPPDIDIELWRESIAAIGERSPERLLLTHYGAVDEPARHLAETEAELLRVAESSRPGDRGLLLGELDRRIDAEAPEVAERTRSAMPPELTWLGLERYWRKRRERDRD